MDIDCRRVISYLIKDGKTEFDRRRNKKEYELLVDKVEEIRKTPVYRWPEKRQH